MKNRKKLMLLVMVAAIATSMTACSLFGDDEKDSQIVVETSPTPTPEVEAEPTPSIAADVQTTIYTSANKLISIELPDATWSNKMDEDNIWSFESPKVGKILITYGSGEEEMSSTVFPDSEDMANSLEEAAGLEKGTDFTVSYYTAKERDGIDVYTYWVKYHDKEKSDGYVYAVNRVFANENEYFSIVGSVKNKAGFQAIKDAIKTFRISSKSTLNAVAPMEGVIAEIVDTELDEMVDLVTADDSADTSSGTDGFTEEELNDTNKTRTLYRNSDGSALVIYADSNGNWVDKEGNTYDFANDEDVYDQNGEDYYYHGESANVYYMPVS